MMSFPSTLNRGGSNLQVTNVPSSVKDTLVASFKAAFTQGKSSMTSGGELDTTGIRYNAERDKATLLDNTNLAANGQLQFNHKVDSSKYVYEDQMHIPLNAIEVMNKYKAVIYNGPLEYLHRAHKNGNSKDVKYNQIHVNGLTGSLFNPYYGMLYKGPTPTTPLMNNQEPSYKGYTDDCSIKNLVKLSNSKDDKTSPLGQARYKYADFMYCKDLGKFANNHLLTLRRFSTAVGDNIFTEAALKNDKYNNWIRMGDIGRLVTWFGNEDNKLEDILKYDYSASWKEMSAEWNQQQSRENEGATDGKGLKNVLNKTLLLAGQAPYNYAKSIVEGTNPAARLPFIGKLIDSGQYENDPVVLGYNYDEHKIYEPKDTVRKTHVYDGELTFNNEFNITFNYTLRAYDNINPKAAFLDLLGNIMVVTYRRGTFWGGKNEVMGVQQDSQGWNLANNIIHNGVETVRSFLEQMISGGTEEFMGSMLGAVSNAFQGLKNAGNKMLEWAKGQDMKSLAINLLNRAAPIGEGLLKNYLGRPAVYKFNSLLNGGDVGLWHLTVGNPLNPIIAMGNLIMTKAEIQHYGPLGVDDFPTGLKVTVTLKHAQSRDATKIERMYTQGLGTIYQSMNAIKNQSQVYKNMTVADSSKPVANSSAPTSGQQSNTGQSNNNMNVVGEVSVDQLKKWDTTKQARQKTQEYANSSIITDMCNQDLANYQAELQNKKLAPSDNTNTIINVTNAPDMNQNLISPEYEEMYNYLGEWDPERLQANRYQLA